MVNITLNICRLCLKACDDSDVIHDSDKDIFQIIIPQIALDIGGNDRICKNCAMLLKQSFEFKSKCLEIEDSIHYFKTDGQIQVNLEKALGIKEETKCIRICRTCSDDLKNNAYVELNTRNGLRSIFQKCLPEVDLELTVKPVICFSCEGTLKKLFHFVTSCEKNEEKNRPHFKNSNKNNGTKNFMRTVEESNVPKILLDANINKGIYIVSDSDDNDNNEVIEASKKRKTIGGIIKLKKTSRVLEEIISNENLSSENIVLNDTSYFSSPVTNCEESVSNSEPDLTSKKVGNEGLENLNIIEIKSSSVKLNSENNKQKDISRVPTTLNIFPISNLTGIIERSKVPKVLSAGINNEIYIVSDSDDNDNIKAIQMPKKRKTSNSKIKSNNPTAVIDGEISLNDDSDCTWVDSGNSTDSSVEWFEAPEKCKRTKKRKLAAPTKPIQLEKYVFCKYCLFSTTSSWAIKRHITSCLRSPFPKNLTTSVQKNRMLTNSSGNQGFYDKESVQNSIATSGNIEKSPKITIIESITLNMLKDNAERLERRHSSYIQEKRNYESCLKKDSFIHATATKPSTLNSKDVNKIGHQRNRNMMKMIKNSNKNLKNCLTVATKVKPKPSGTNFKRTRRADQIKTNKKQLKDGLIVTTQRISAELEAPSLKSKGTLEERDETNISEKRTSNCSEESTKRSELLIDKDCFPVASEGTAIEEPSTFSSQGIQGGDLIQSSLAFDNTHSVQKNNNAITKNIKGPLEVTKSSLNLKKNRRKEVTKEVEMLKNVNNNNNIVTTEETPTELEISSKNLNSIPEEQDKTIETSSTLVTVESTGRNSCELSINKEGTSIENPEPARLISKGIQIASFTEQDPSNLNFKGTSEEQDETNEATRPSVISTSMERSTGSNFCDLVLDRDCATVAAEGTSMEEPEPCRLNSQSTQKNNIAMTENIKEPLVVTKARLKLKSMRKKHREKGQMLKTIIKKNHKNELIVATEATSLNFKDTPEEQDKTTELFNTLVSSNSTRESTGRNSCELSINKDCLTVATQGTSIKKPEQARPISKGSQRESDILEMKKLESSIQNNQKKSLSVLEILMCRRCTFNTRSVLKMAMHQTVHLTTSEMRVNYSTGYKTVYTCVICGKQCTTMTTELQDHANRCVQKCIMQPFLLQAGDVLHCTRCYFDSNDPKLVMQHLVKCAHI